VVNDPSIVALLTLRLRYDDGFVAFVNDSEVARVNAPLTPLYNSTATNNHPAISAEEFRVGPATLQAGTNILAIQGLNVSAADADFLVQAELVAANITGASSTPVYFTQPSPGTPNSGGVAAPGPAIVSESHSPNVPLDADDLRVTARVAGTFNPVAGVVMRYRIMFDPEIEVQMFDDGSHGDGAPGDGIFGATIPASASTNGQMIRWYFVATDNRGYTSRWPLFADPAGTPEYLGTIVNPTNVTSVLPIVHLFVDPAQQSAVDGQAGGRASVFYDGEFYDNVEMELRGNSTAGYLKKSHRFKFNNEHKFRHFGPGGRIQDTSFEADYPDPTYMRQGMSFWLLEQIGVPAPFYIPARLQLNAQFYQMANHCNVNGEELLSYLGYDPNGALYKAAGTVQPSQFSTGVFEKKTRKWEDNSDYTALANAVAETLPTGMRKTNIFEMLDLPEVISYLIGARFVQENDDVWANMTLYHDNDGDHLWRIVPFDMNLSWGAFFLDNAANDTGIQATNDNHKSFPLYGSSQALSLTSGNWNRMYDVIFTVPETRQMFLRRMRSILDAYVKPIGTAPGLTPIEQHMLAWRDLIIPEANNDRAKWGWPAIGGQGNLPPGTNVFFGVSDLLQQFFYPRRNHFYGKHSVANTSLPIGISKTQNAGIPLPQPPSSAVQIVAVDYNPSSGNQAQEYVQLTNANPWAIDLSGWKLNGAVQFTFRAGTVIPSTSSMFVSPDVLAFRSRTSGPRGGQGLFVVGPYKGQLSARGESVSVYDSFGRLIHSYSFVGNPSPLQLYLRITEVMYHPAPPPAGSPYSPEDFEYIELKNIGPLTLNLTGVHFTNGVEFSFTGSAVTSLAPGQRVLVVKNSAAFASRYPSATGIAGAYLGNLENNGETIRLDDAVGEKILEFKYNNSWYPITDGLGFSLVIKDENASWDTWADAQSWRPSSQLGGSPSLDDPAPPAIPAVLVNEALTRTDFPPPTDTIELYNPTAAAADIGGWFLTDDFNTPKKYRIPNGTSIAAGGYITFNESQFNPNPGVPPSFALSANGDEVYLFSGDANTNLTGYVHGFNFGAAEDGVSFGRYITSDGEEHFVAQSARSLGSANAGPKVGPIVVSEIMYRPPDIGTNDNSLDEYIELFNLSPDAVNLYDPTLTTNTWQIKGGVDFVFPQGTSLAAGQYLLLVNFNPADTTTASAFRARFGVPDAVALFGPYGGKLDNSSDNVELKKPTILTGGIVAYVLVDKVSYKDSAPWPPGADGYGLSLQRKATHQYGNDPINWTAAPPSPGSAPAATFGAPVITAQPTNQTIVAYADTQLSIGATGPGLGYQWRFHGMNIAGATNATLPLPNLQPEQGGDYQVVVYNGAGSQVSDTAVVTLFYPVSVIAQPVSLTARLANVTTVINTNLTFSVLGASSGQISYQWRFNGNNIPGATNNVYTITRLSITNYGTYQAVLNDGIQTVMSDPATLSVFVALTITQNLPTAVTAVQGDSVPYTLSINGFPPPFFFQFRKGSSNVSDITTPSTTATFTLLNVQPPDGGAYRIVITNLGNTAIATVNSTLTVLADSDGDHIPDSWETQYGFNPNSAADGSDDPDHDGLTNLQEYRAGTNPTNALSTLKLGSFLVNTQSVFSFLAASNKTYSVQYSPSLLNGSWINLTNLSSRTTNRTALITDRSIVTNRFYRVVTPQQP